MDDWESSAAAAATALADCDVTVEHQTLINCTMELRNAVSNSLIQLSGRLLANGLITQHNDSELRSRYILEADRAAKLVEIIQGKVQLDHHNYNKFIDILIEEDSDYYKDILTTLSKTFHQGNIYIICIIIILSLYMVIPFQ